MTKYVFAFESLTPTFEGESRGHKVVDLPNVIAAYNYVEKYNERAFRAFKCFFLGALNEDTLPAEHLRVK